MILVFGSINADLIVPVPRLPRPSETVLGGNYALLPGGKGANQALAARRAGTAVALAGAVGNDAFAGLALENLRQEGVDLALGRRGEGANGCALVNGGAAGTQRGQKLNAVAAVVPDAMLGPGTVLVCQMEVPPDENWALIRRARAAGGRIALNLAPAAPVPAELLGANDLLVANRGEAATLGADPAALA